MQTVLAAQIAAALDDREQLTRQLKRLPGQITAESDPDIFPYAIALAEQLQLHPAAITLAEQWLDRQPDNPDAAFAALSLPLTPEASAGELQRFAEFTAAPHPEVMLLRIARQLAALPPDALLAFTAAQPEAAAVWLTAGLAAWQQAAINHARDYFTRSLAHAPDWELPALYQLLYTPPAPPPRALTSIASARLMRICLPTSNAAPAPCAPLPLY